MARTKTILGKVPIGRGAYSNNTEYYKENTVTLYGMSFRAISDKFRGYAPARIDGSGNAVLQNTDKWELLSGHPEAYNNNKEVEKLNQRVDNQDKTIKAYTEKVDKYKPIVINGDVVNTADEEDITSDENKLLKLKDRPATDGMGYVILRKNKTFAEQVTQPNTIYEIRYDFDLGGEEVEIPENCVLKFEGGRLSNGSITLNKTKLYGIVKCHNMIRINGIAGNNIINSNNFTFVKDIDKLNFLFNQIKDNTTITIDGVYEIDFEEISFSSETIEFLSGRANTIVYWKKYENIDNLIITGGGSIMFKNCPTTSYKEILYFNKINNSTISGLVVIGDVEYYKSNIAYGINFIKIIGDSSNVTVNIQANHFAIPFYYGDYYGNDGKTGLINSNITVRGQGNKYGSRIHYAQKCNIFIENSYGHRGLYLGGGISHCKIRTECKFMDTSAAVIIGNTYVNEKMEGAHDLYIETHDTGTIQENTDIIPARVYINSHGGTIDNGLSMRDYHIIYENIDITVTFSKETYILESFMPFIITSQGLDTGRELVPKDIKRNIKVKMILTNGAIVKDRSLLQMYSTYDGRMDEIDLYYEIINNSDNQDIIYSGTFGLNNDHSITIKTPNRITPYTWRGSLLDKDWLITNEQNQGTFKLTFKDTSLYLPLPESIQQMIKDRDEAIPEYIILDNCLSVSGASYVVRYTPNMKLYHSRGSSSQRPYALAGDIYFDTTLNKPIWWNGTKWVDATGAEV